MAQQDRTPAYTVVKVTGTDSHGEPTSIEIIQRRTEAKTHEKATDMVVDELPEPERNGEFGAFLADNLKTWEYGTTTEVVTQKKAKVSGAVRRRRADRDKAERTATMPEGETG